MALGQLAHRQPLALGHVDGALAAGLAGVGLRDRRQRPVRIELRRIHPQRDGQRGDRAFVVHQAVELGVQPPGRLHRLAEHHHRARQHLDVVGVAPGRPGPRLDVGIERLGPLQVGRRREHHLRRLRRQLPAHARGARLDDHRPALHGAGDVQRPAHGEVLPLVVEPVHPPGVPEDPAGLVAQEGVVGEAVPEPGDHVVELPRAAVALVVLHVVVEAEVQRRLRVGGGDNVPAGAAAGDVVQRGEPAGHVVGRVEGGGGGGDQPDPLGLGGQVAQERERLERGHRVAAPQRLDRHVQHRQVVGHEEGVELGRLQPLDAVGQERQVEVGVGLGARIAPRAGVDGGRAHEGAEVQLPALSHRTCLPRPRTTTSSPWCRDRRRGAGAGRRRARSRWSAAGRSGCRGWRPWPCGRRGW